jgi:hypothetical protein
MKSNFLFPLILFAGLMLADFSANPVYGQTSQKEQVKQQTSMFTCSVHPEVVQDQPGNCSKCGMKLVGKKDMPKENISQAPDSACMKHESMKMDIDSTCVKHEHMKMMPDSTMVRKDSIIQNPQFKKHEDMDM